MQDRRHGSTQSRFARRLALYEANGNRVVGQAAFEDARLEAAREDFARATLARKLAPKSATAKRGQIRAYLSLCDAMKKAEVAR